MEERIVTADPVADPQGYQRELLALLGGSDPLTLLTATPQAVHELTASLPSQKLDRRPAPDEWSVAELLGHFWDSEIAFSFRARLILAQDKPQLIGYDQDAWATLARPPFVELLPAFTALRRANLVLIEQTPQALWDRVGHHTERGPISFRVLTETMAGHDRAHLRQLENTVAAL
jgi:DinB superfamily